MNTIQEGQYLDEMEAEVIRILGSLPPTYFREYVAIDYNIDSKDAALKYVIGYKS
jgi:hypothetical protein